MVNCSVDNCFNVRKYIKLGLCGTHYERKRIFGDINYVKNTVKQQCTFENCNKESYTVKGNTCYTHYHKMRRELSPDYIPKKLIIPIILPNGREEYHFDVIESIVYHFPKLLDKITREKNYDIDVYLDNIVSDYKHIIRELMQFHNFTYLTSDEKINTLLKTSLHNTSKDEIYDKSLINFNIDQDLGPIISTWTSFVGHEYGFKSDMDEWGVVTFSWKLLQVPANLNHNYFHTALNTLKETNGSKSTFCIKWKIHPYLLDYLFF